MPNGLFEDRQQVVKLLGRLPFDLVAKNCSLSKQLPTRLCLDEVFYFGPVLPVEPQSLEEIPLVDLRPSRAFLDSTFDWPVD